MEKNNSLLYGILGGVIACFICVAMVFIFPSKGNTNLKGNNPIKSNQSGNVSVGDEEISLGDDGGHCLPQSAVPSSACSGLDQAACEAATQCYWYVVPTSCPAGQYLSSNTCNNCPTGYTSVAGATARSECYINVPAGKKLAANSGTPTDCDAGTYASSSRRIYYGGSASCSACTGTKEYSLAGATTCLTCTNGDANSAHTGCENPTISGCGTGQWRGENSCESCPAGYKCPDTISRVACNGANEYQDETGQTSCKICSNGTPNSNHTACVTTTTCNNNQYLDSNNECKTCTAGYWCNGVARTACGAGKTSAAGSSGINSCTPCPAGTYNGSAAGTCQACTGEDKYSYEGATTCSTCESGVASTGHTGCTNPPSSGCSSGQWRGENNCEACPAGYMCNDNVSKVFCSGEDQYQNQTGQTYCKTCPTGEKADSTHTRCVSATEACDSTSKYIDSNGQCQTCTAGYWCNGVARTACPKGKSSAAGSASASACVTCTGNTYNASAGSTCKACPDTNSTPNTDHTSCVCKTGYILRDAKCTEIDYSQCDVSAVTSSKVTSVDVDNVDNSYYTVTVTATGLFCTGQNLAFTATNAKSISPTSASITSNSSSSSYTFKVYPKNPCEASRATATLDKNGKSSTTSSVNLRTDWVKTENVCGKSPRYTSFEAADAAGANEYYSNYGTCKDGTSGYTVRWNRAGCGGGTTNLKYSYCCVKNDKSDYSWKVDQSTKTCPDGYTIDESLNSNTCSPSTPKYIPYCYIDDGGEYQWTSSPMPSWIKVEGVTKESDCQKEEVPACYMDKQGEYIWGKYAKNDGYTLITSIKDEASCKKPTAEYACYKNDAGDYRWTTTAPEGYTKVDSIKTPVECAPPENPACYVHGNEFIWGKYDNVKGYIKLWDVTREEDCNLPDSDACYIDPNGKYVWGKYGNDSSYTLVPAVQEASKCTNDVPVEPTASNVSKLVYVFMAILMACGISFIYYSSVIKKSNQ